jgi:hypothetical protein
VKTKVKPKPMVKKSAEVKPAPLNLTPKDYDALRRLLLKSDADYRGRGYFPRNDLERLEQRNSDLASFGMSRLSMPTMWAMVRGDRVEVIHQRKENLDEVEVEPVKVRKKPGVVAKIVEVLKAASAKKPVTKDDILKVLVKEFPDRDPRAMKSTISSQVPSCLKTEKGLVCKSNAKGWWLD